MSQKSVVAHYSFFPNRLCWPPSRSQLTYAFAPENQLTDAVRGVFQRAFERWSEVTTRIGFFSGDENWDIDGDFLGGSPFSAVDLESVAVHEIGHLLGLSHSSVEEAIMYPSISSGIQNVELANDDVLGISELYGSNPSYNGPGPVLTPRGERDTSSLAFRFGGDSNYYFWLI